MSDGYAADEPRHVEQAGIDEDVRTISILGAKEILIKLMRIDGDYSAHSLRLVPNEKLITHPVLRAKLGSALRVLRHFGLLVEHGEGVVSIKETP